MQNAQPTADELFIECAKDVYREVTGQEPIELAGCIGQQMTADNPGKIIFGFAHPEDHDKGILLLLKYKSNVTDGRTDLYAVAAYARFVEFLGTAEQNGGNDKFVRETIARSIGFRDPALVRF